MLIVFPVILLNTNPSFKSIWKLLQALGVKSGQEMGQLVERTKSTIESVIAAEQHTAAAVKQIKWGQVMVKAENLRGERSPLFLMCVYVYTRQHPSWHLSSSHIRREKKVIGPKKIGWETCSGAAHIGSGDEGGRGHWFLEVGRKGETRASFPISFFTFDVGYFVSWRLFVGLLLAKTRR